MPFKNGTIPPNSIIWTKEMEAFLKDNYKHMTNAELAKHLGLKKTACRMKLYELSCKRIEMEYWNKEEIKYLQDNYKTTGDVELAEYFNKNFPKNKKWTKSHISKKRGYLKLQRTAEEYDALRTLNSSPGGRCFTIIKNSSSKNMHPMWVAQRVAWRDPELQRELIKHPEIIEAARGIIKLNREIKLKKDGTIRC